MIRQEGTTSQPWDGAGSAPSHLSPGDSGSGNSKKSKIKKKRRGKKRLWSQFVEIVKARKPFISELDTVNIKNWVS